MEYFLPPSPSLLSFGLIPACFFIFTPLFQSIPLQKLRIAVTSRKYSPQVGLHFVGNSHGISCFLAEIRYMAWAFRLRKFWKFCISIVFNFSWDDCKSHKELKTFIMQNVIYEKGPLKKAHLSSKVSQGEG